MGPLALGKTNETVCLFVAGRERDAQAARRIERQNLSLSRAHVHKVTLGSEVRPARVIGGRG